MERNVSDKIEKIIMMIILLLLVADVCDNVMSRVTGEREGGNAEEHAFI